MEVFQVKRVLGMILAVAVLAALALLPASAAAWDKTINATILDEDFDKVRIIV